MTKDDVAEFYIGLGFKEDRYGNLKQKTENGEMRIKFQKTSFRREAKPTGCSLWINQSAKPMYYSQLEVNPDTNKLRKKV